MTLGFEFNQVSYYNGFKHGNQVLLHGIAVPDGNAAVLQRVEVDGDAEGGSNLILPAIPLSYTPRIVELNIVMPA